MLRPHPQPSSYLIQEHCDFVSRATWFILYMGRGYSQFKRLMDEVRLGRKRFRGCNEGYMGCHLHFFFLIVIYLFCLLTTLARETHAGKKRKDLVGGPLCGPRVPPRSSWHLPQLLRNQNISSAPLVHSPSSHSKAIRHKPSPEMPGYTTRVSQEPPSLLSAMLMVSTRCKRALEKDPGPQLPGGTHTTHRARKAGLVHTISRL